MFDGTLESEDEKFEEFEKELLAHFKDDVAGMDLKGIEMVKLYFFVLNFYFFVVTFLFCHFYYVFWFCLNRFFFLSANPAISMSLSSALKKLQQ